MKTIQKFYSNPILWIAAIVGVAVVAIMMVWQFSSIAFQAAGDSQRAFTLKVDYDKFRQILVRTDVTREIVSASGQTLKEDNLQSLEIDATQDKRPILNALLGKSKTELDAEKHMVVSVKNSEVDLDSLALTQHAQIGNEEILVRTVSDKPTGKLESYETVLSAKRVANATEMKLDVRLKVNTVIPRAFQGVANQRVQAAADKITKDLEAVLSDIVARHEKENIIRPKL